MKKQLTQADRQEFVTLKKRYGLLDSDFHVNPQGWVIITRKGLERIHSGLGCTVSYEVVPELTDLTIPAVTIKATAISKDHKNDYKIESYGEANAQNTIAGARKYLVAMAEKRAFSRVILKASQFYKLEVLGEDETIDDENGLPVSPKQGVQRLARISEQPKTTNK